jgi:hypothetical protein
MNLAEPLRQDGIARSNRRSGEAIRSPLAGDTAPMGFGIGTQSEGHNADDLPISKPPLPTQELVNVNKPERFPDNSEAGMGLASELQGRARRDDFAYLTRKAVTGTIVAAPGRIKGFRLLMEKWGFSRKDAAEILGFENEGLIGELYAGIEKVQQRDVRDRLKLFLSLAVDLDGLYDDDQVIKQWLDQPKKLLRSKTPRELLVEGSMENLLRVRQLVRYEANR